MREIWYIPGTDNYFDVGNWLDGTATESDS